MKQTIENTDKLIHFIAGMIVSISVIYVPQLVAMIMICCAAIGKEVYDYFHPGHIPCALDAIVTICGGMFGLMLISLA